MLNWYFYSTFPGDVNQDFETSKNTKIYISQNPKNTKYRVHTKQRNGGTKNKHCNRRTNIKTCTMLYYISVLLVSLVWILSICHFSTVFPEIFVQSSKSNVYISIFELRCVLLSLFWLSSGNCAHTLQATYKHQNLHNVILY